MLNWDRMTTEGDTCEAKPMLGVVMCLDMVVGGLPHDVQQVNVTRQIEFGRDA